MTHSEVCQVNGMLTAAELKVALGVVTVQVTVLGGQLEEAAVREAKEVKVGS